MIDVIKLAEAASDYAYEKIAQPGEFHQDWHKVRDERFAALVLEEAAKKCDGPEWMEDWEIRGGAEGREIYRDIAAAIRALKPQTQE